MTMKNTTQLNKEKDEYGLCLIHADNVNNFFIYYAYSEYYLLENHFIIICDFVKLHLYDREVYFEFFDSRNDLWFDVKISLLDWIKIVQSPFDFSKILEHEKELKSFYPNSKDHFKIECDVDFIRKKIGGLENMKVFV